MVPLLAKLFRVRVNRTLTTLAGCSSRSVETGSRRYRPLSLDHLVLRVIQGVPTYPSAGRRPRRLYYGGTRRGDKTEGKRDGNHRRCPHGSSAIGNRRSPHWITSSARTITDRGIVSPRALVLVEQHVVGGRRRVTPNLAPFTPLIP